MTGRCRILPWDVFEACGLVEARWFSVCCAVWYAISAHVGRRDAKLAFRTIGHMIAMVHIQVMMAGLGVDLVVLSGLLVSSFPDDCDPSALDVFGLCARIQIFDI